MCIVKVPVNRSMDQNVLIWNGTVLSGGGVTISISNMSTTNIVPSSAINNVSILENHALNCSCFQSTLNFTGTNLAALFNESLSCKTNDIATIAVMVPHRKLSVI